MEAMKEPERESFLGMASRSTVARADSDVRPFIVFRSLSLIRNDKS